MYNDKPHNNYRSPVSARWFSWFMKIPMMLLFNPFSLSAQTTHFIVPNSTLYCMYSQTWHQETNSGLSLVVSKNWGTTWSSPTTVVTNTLGMSGGAFGVTASGRLVCIYATAMVPYYGYPSNSWTNIAVIYSDDGGQTWSNGFIPNNRVWSATNEWNYSGRSTQPIAPAPFGQIRQVGSTLFAGAYETWTTDTRASYVLISTNNGISWYPHVLSFKTNAASETEILPISDKVLLAGIRHDDIGANTTILSLSGSTDGGLTWTNLGWIPTAVAYSAQNPVGLNLFQAADGLHVFMAYGDRGSGKLYISEAPLSQVWANPAVLYSNRIAVASISGSLNDDGGYASAANLDNSGDYLISYYYAPFAGGYIPGCLTNASIRFLEVTATSLSSTNLSSSGSVLTNLPNQYPYEGFPVLVTTLTNAFSEVSLPPVLWPIPNQTVTVGKTLAFTNTAVDLAGNQLTFSLKPVAPTNALLNATNGVFSWTPTQDQIGSNAFTVVVTDNSQPPLSATRSFVVTVQTNSSQFSVPAMIRLIWNYPTNALSTNLTFAILHSSDLTVPITQWPVLTNVVGTNPSASVSMGSGQDFFIISAQDSTGGTNYQISNVPSFQTTISLTGSN